MKSTVPKVLTLTPEQFERYQRLPPRENFAWRFWKEMAKLHGLNLEGTKDRVVSLRWAGGTRFTVTESPRKLSEDAIRFAQKSTY